MDQMVDISDNKIREISEASLKIFIEILDQSQGDYLRAVCGAADPLLQYLVYENSTTTEFAIERTDAVDILQLPKGSDELLRLLQGMLPLPKFARRHLTRSNASIKFGLKYKNLRP